MKAFSVLPLFLALAALPQLKAELLIGLTVQNSLISFDSATPSTISTPVAIGGLLAGDTITGIDRRPQAGPNNGLLYGLGVNSSTGSGRIYTLNPTTGTATLVSTLAADPTDTVAPFPFTTVNGTEFGVDFNPTVDRFRIVSNIGQNLRVNVDNGLVQLDVPLAYQSGDPNFGAVPSITSVAYSNNFGGATTTVLRGVDDNRDALDVFTNPNSGLLQTALPTGFNSGLFAGYDISGITGTPYFSFTAPGGSSLFTISGGSVSLIGTIGGGVAIRGLAAPVGDSLSVPESGQSLLFLSAALILLGAVRRIPALGVSCRR